MKRLQRFCGVLSLALILAAPVVAGDMQTGIAQPPPPPPPSAGSPTNTPESGTQPAVNNPSEESMLVFTLEQIAWFILQGIWIGH